MAQVALHRFDVVPAFYRCHGIRMPLWHNKDKSENPCVARSWLFVLILFPPKNDPKMGSTGGDDKRKLHAKDKFPWTKVSGQNQDFLKLFRGAKT